MKDNYYTSAIFPDVFEIESLRYGVADYCLLYQEFLS